MGWTKAAMVKSINVGGKSENLPSDKFKYEDAFTIAGEVMKHAIDLVNSHDFESKDSWKLDCKSDDVTVHYKDFELGRYFAGRCKVKISAKDLADQLYNNIHTDHEWNENVRYAKRHHQLTPFVDIIEFASNDYLIVKSRDFVSARCLREINGSWILAGRSITLDEIPEIKDSVRGTIHFAMSRAVPDPEDPEHSCIYDYVSCMEMKGMLIKSAVNQIMGRATLEDIKCVRQHAENVLHKKLYPGL